MGGRVEKLNKGGILAWEVDGVLGRLTKAQSTAFRRGELFALQLPPLVEMGVVVATHMRDRAQGRGVLADSPPEAPSERRGWHKEAGNWVAGQVVSPEYAAAAGLPSTTYASSADLHRAAGKIGVGNVTGGMWAGIQARGSGRSAVIIDFGGSSPGHGGAATYATKGASVGSEGGKPIPLMVRAPETVRNQQKAWVVFSKHKASPIEPSPTENIAMCEAATILAQKTVLKQFGDSDNDYQHGLALDFGGDSALREKLLRDWKL